MLCYVLVSFNVHIIPNNGQFFVINRATNELVMTGDISSTTTKSAEPTTGKLQHQSPSNYCAEPSDLGREDIYKELRVAGIDYGRAFQGVLASKGALLYLTWRKFLGLFLFTYMRVI